MRQIALLLIAVTAAGIVAYKGTASGQADGQAPVFVTRIPPGYRDWKLISVAHEEGDLHSFAAVLGNDIAIKAYREAKLPFPDGAIIAALHWDRVTSEENNRVLAGAGTGAQSFVPGSRVNVQFMVKDSKRYAATGGWGFADFKDGKPGDEALHKTCFPCHAPARDHDFVYTRYAP